MKVEKKSAFAVFKANQAKELQIVKNNQPERLLSNRSGKVDGKGKVKVAAKKKKNAMKSPHQRPSCLPSEAFMQSPLESLNTGVRMKGFHEKQGDGVQAESNGVPPKMKSASQVEKGPVTPKQGRKKGGSPGNSSKKKVEGKSANGKGSNKKLKRKRTSKGGDVIGMSSNATPNTREGGDESDEDFLELQIDEMEQMEDSQTAASTTFEWLIGPVKPHKFFKELWERKPLLVKRHQPKYYEGWFSTDEMDHILRTENIKYTVNLDVVSYQNGKRETHNPEGRAYAPVVWDYFQNGCSLRMLNPQTYSKNIWRLNSCLTEYFSSFVGMNVYLTPAGTQGFAPHWDDIDAFVMQIEGKKHWRLYNPRSEDEMLPRYSSPNFTQEEIGEPILDVVLEAGDMLYFPRGFIHQADTMEDTHSLHVTLSTCQRNTWGDLLEKLVPQALEAAIAEDSAFRQSLPRDYMNYMGVVSSEKDSKERKDFLAKVQDLMGRLFKHASVDGAADQTAKSVIHDSLPPVISDYEASRSVFGTGEHWEDGRVAGRVEMEPDSEVKLLRKGVLRMAVEDDSIRIYHCLENTRVYHEVEEPQFYEIEPQMAPAVEYLLNAYPEYVLVDHLPLDDVDDKVGLATSLYEKGLLVTRAPLQSIFYNDD